MPHSLRAKLSGLRYKGILEDKDYKRLCHALDLEKAEQEQTDDKCHYCEHNFTPYQGNTGEFTEQEPCDDVVSRQAVLDYLKANVDDFPDYHEAIEKVLQIPSVRPQEQTGHCKDCKYFEYDSVAKVDGVPLIVAHEICNKWGDGCKTKEDGYCFLFEESEDKK